MNLNFNLKGVIEHTQFYGGHYIAHVKRNNGVWETYDSVAAPKVEKPSRNVGAVLLVYLLNEKENPISFIGEDCTESFS